MIFKNNANITVLLNIVSTFILQGVAFFTTPVFTKLLGTSQFGLYSLFNSWVLILTSFIGFSMHSSIGTGFYYFKDNYLSFRNSVLLTSTLIGIAEIIVITFFVQSLNSLLNIDMWLYALIAICALSRYFVCFSQLSFIYEKRAWDNFFLSIITSLASVVLSIYFINQSTEIERYLGRIYGVTITYCMVGVFCWALLFLQKPSGFNKDYFKYSLSIGFPIIFHTLSQQILGQSDRIMMQFFSIKMETIGVYSFYYTLSSALSTILIALNNSWCPFYYDDLNNKEWNILEEKCKNYIELFTVISIGFLFLAREVTYLIVDKSFWTGINIIPILTFIVFFTFMYQFPVNFEFYHKKTQIISIGTVASGIINIILNLFMIPLWGMYGAAIATCLSFLGLFVVHYVIVVNMKKHPFHLNYKVFLLPLCFMIIACCLFYLEQCPWFIRWILAFILGIRELYKIIKRKSIF